MAEAAPAAYDKDVHSCRSGETSRPPARSLLALLDRPLAGCWTHPTEPTLSTLRCCQRCQRARHEIGGS